MRVRLAAVTAVVAALTMVLASCDSSGSGRRGGGSSSSGGSSSGQGDHDDDDIDVDIDDIGAPDAGGGGEEPQPGESLPATEATATSILPDQAAMAGTVFTSVSEGTSSYCDDYPDNCDTVIARDAIGFRNDTGDHAVGFELLIHGNAPDALATMDGAEQTLLDDGFTPGSLTTGGDEGASYVLNEDDVTIHVAIIQQGPYLGAVSRSGSPADLADTGLGNALNAMFAERIAQADAGQQPTATVE